MSSDHELFWQGLVSRALVGTARQPSAQGLPEEPLSDLAMQLNEQAPEPGLIGMAVLLSLYRRAGHVPAIVEHPPVPPCEHDDMPCCSPRASQHLALMLRGQQREILPEWLQVAARAGVRVADQHLPDLLELGVARKDLRGEVLALLGKRGRWLAAQNPEWEYAIADLSSVEQSASDTQRESWGSIWQTSGRVARLALLAELRRARPAYARELLLTTWVEEKADDRAAFVAVLKTGLSIDDEPFLEGALDDRSKEVRRVAAQLLSRLPQSQLVGRMRARVEPLLRWVPGRKPVILVPGRKPVIEVSLPEDCDKSMKRDGVEQRPPYPSVGDRAWWLFQLLSAIPPSLWSQRWQEPPAELLAAAQRGEWEPVLIGGWAQAASHNQDADWAEAIVQHWVAYADNSKAFLGSGAILQELLEVLPAERSDRLLLSLLGPQCVPLHRHPLMHLLRQAKYPWSPALSRAVLEIVRLHIARWSDGYDYELRGALTAEFPRYMSTTILSEAVSGWPTDAKHWDSWHEAVDDFLSVLQFRHEMLGALNEGDHS